jgi:AraC-like DNA-binding protein
MKAIKEIIQFSRNSSFVIRDLQSINFSVPWHYHDVFEIVYAINHSGKKFSGDSVTDFYPGDLICIGGNLPHSFINNTFHHSKSSGSGAHVMILQIPSDFFPAVKMQSPEMANISSLLRNSVGGLSFSGDDASFGGELLKQLLHAVGIDRILLILRLLDFLGHTESVGLASQSYINQMEDAGELRLNKVYQFLSLNCNRKIMLDEVAAMVSMNSTAFSRYFSQKTGKTFSEYLNELRILHSCSLLRHSPQSVSEISDESGYNNLSNFNRQFKKFIGKSPSEYRILYQQMGENGV